MADQPLECGDDSACQPVSSSGHHRQAASYAGFRGNADAAVVHLERAFVGIHLKIVGFTDHPKLADDDSPLLVMADRRDVGQQSALRGTGRAMGAAIGILAAGAGPGGVDAIAASP